MDDLTTDVTDTREIQDRIDELVADIADLVSASEDFEEESEELDALEEFKSLFDADDWSGGTTIIAESHFTEYAEEYAKDIGLINGETESWPFTAIDWEQAASDLQQDYTSYEFNGETYWARD